jgi:outer membrane protein OmpA-like peptidoglycan-associated protein
MATVLEEKKSNVMMIIILLVSLLCVGASGFMWYKATNVTDSNTAKVVELEKAIKNMQDNINKQADIIANLNTQLKNASDEKNLLLAEIATLKSVAVTSTPTVVVETPVQASVEGTVQSVSAIAFFDFGKFDLKDEYKVELDKVVDLIKKKKSALVIEGHTDSIGDPDFNVWLSKQRADAVKNYILSKAEPDKPCNIISIGVGSTKQKNRDVPNKEKRKVLVTAVEDCKGAL